MILLTAAMPLTKHGTRSSYSHASVQSRTLATLGCISMKTFHNLCEVLPGLLNATKTSHMHRVFAVRPNRLFLDA